MIAQIDNCNDTLSEIKQILIDVSGTKLMAEDIPDMADPVDDCGLDSISIVEFVVSIEKRFGVILVNEGIDLDVIRNLSHLADFVDQETHKFEVVKHGR